MSENAAVIFTMEFFHAVLTRRRRSPADRRAAARHPPTRATRFPYQWMIPLFGDGLIGLLAPFYCWLASARRGPRVFAMVAAYLFWGIWNFICGIWVDVSSPPKTGTPVEGLAFWLIFNMCLEFAALFALMTPTVANYYTHDLEGSLLEVPGAHVADFWKTVGCPADITGDL